MTTAQPAVTTEVRDERESRFAEAIASLRTKATAGDAERWFRLAGPVLIPLGALVILLGWWGAANTTRVFLQIPYLISGGVFGLGLMFTGGFAYFARWMTDLLEESRRRADAAEETARQTVEALERIEGLLAAGAVGGGAAVVADDGWEYEYVEVDDDEWGVTEGDWADDEWDESWDEAASGTNGDTPTLVATASGKLAHSPECHLVAGRDTHVLSSDEAAERDLCRICQPAT